MKGHIFHPVLRKFDFYAPFVKQWISGCCQNSKKNLSLRLNIHTFSVDPKSKKFNYMCFILLKIKIHMDALSLDQAQRKKTYYYNTGDTKSR